MSASGLRKFERDCWSRWLLQASLVVRVWLVLGVVALTGGLACSTAKTATRPITVQTSTAAAASSTPEPEARIWTVAVGVSNYQQTDISLQYAAKDAVDIDTFFANEAAGAAVPAERRVLLTDSKATRASAIQGLRSIALSTGPEDVLVVFLAMHGVPEADGELYFATYDTAKENLAGTALSQTDVERILQQAPAGRILLLADACHAGAVGLARDQGRSFANSDTNRLVAALAKSRPGMAVFSASRAGENSEEGRQWGGGHGVFTHYVLVGMRGAADADSDQVVTISELEEYVRVHVVKDTGGDQHPELHGKFDNEMPIAIVPAHLSRASAPVDAPSVCQTGPLEDCKTLCDRGSAASCAWMAFAYVNGSRVQQDFARAAALYKKACDGGSAYGCTGLARAYATGAGVRRDAARAAELFELACDGSDASACGQLGSMYQQGSILVKKDQERGNSLLKRGCDGGDAVACYSLGIAYEHGEGVAKDLAASAVLYTRSCDHGYQFGCVQLGDMYARGTGIAKDEARAVELFTGACDSGAPTGCAQLGLAYENGRGVGKDVVRAHGLYEQACDRNEFLGCAALADQLAKGKGTAKDVPRAVSLFEMACNEGSAEACAMLGELYMRGKKIPKDEARALSYFMDSCDQELAEGCFELGWMFAKGMGVKQELTRARDYYEKACNEGFGYACTELGDWYAANRQDKTRAAALYAQSVQGLKQDCDGGDWDACSALGSAYERGKGVVQDDLQAAALYRQACAAGSRAGCVNLAEAYADGRGVARDSTAAAGFFRQSCDGEDEVSCEALAFNYEKGIGVVKNRQKAVELYRGGCALGDDWFCKQLKVAQHSP